MQHEYCTQTLPFGCERRGMGASPAPYLSLQSEQALQRKYELREVYNGLLLSGPHRCPVAHVAP